MPAADGPLLPTALPATGDPDRWPFLQRLRRSPELDLEPWLQAMEAGLFHPQADLLTVLAERFSPEASLRLLQCWESQADPDPDLPPLLGRQRDPELAAWLLSRLQPGLGSSVVSQQTEPLAGLRATALLPLLGHQRDPRAWPVLRHWVLAPFPAVQRRAALEGLAVGLPAWPRAPLRQCLLQLVGDLDPQLAATAVDLLARLPRCRSQLLTLSRRSLDPAVRQRLQRRLAAIPPQPLLLLVHGRSGGRIPAELRDLAAELEQRRGAVVQLLALTEPRLPSPPPADPLAPVATLVPLLLLPGGHVRQDLPRLTAELRRRFPLRRLPFLGSWPLWQRALAAEVRELAASVDSVGAPLLLHHPLQGPLAERFLSLLSRRCGAVCLPASFEDATALPWRHEGWRGAHDPAVLPLALAANRLTDSLLALAPATAPRPLLQRPRLRQVLVEALEALP